MLHKPSFVLIQGGHIVAKKKFPVFSLFYILCYFYAKTNN